MFHEQPQTVHILDLLRDLLPRPTLTEPAYHRRLPLYATLLLAHASRGVFQPSSPTYPLTARFLLQRPEFDATDVPMLYGMLYSSSDDWRREQVWMLRFIADGMLGGAEWRVFKRRHTWDLLATLFESTGEKDTHVRPGVLHVRLQGLWCAAH